MAKITMADIARLVVQKHHLKPNEAERLMTTIVDVINDGLRIDKQVKIKGFGTFKVIETKDRESVNINTGERILIGGRSKITFTPDPSMRDLVNRPFSQFETVVINDGVEFDDIETTQGTNPDEEPAEPSSSEEALAAIVSVADDVQEEVVQEAAPAAVAPIAAFAASQVEPVEEPLPEEPAVSELSSAEQIVEDEEPQVEIVVDEHQEEIQPETEPISEQQSEPKTNLEPEKVMEPEQEKEMETKPEKSSEHEDDNESGHHHHHHHHHHHRHHSHSSERSSQGLSSEAHEYSRQQYYHMRYGHLFEKMEKRHKHRVEWLSAIAVLAVIAAAIGSYYFGKRVGSNELLHEMELSMVDNVLIDSIEHIIATEAYADSAEKAALLEQRRNEYAIRKRALEFTRHSENIDVSARQRAQEMSEAAIRQEAEYLKRMEAEKEANTEAEARQWAKEMQASQQKNNLQVDAEAQAAKAKAEAEAKAAQERATQQAKAQQPKPQQAPKPVAPAQTSGFNSAKYDQMNNQVRLGAYRIVGIDQTVTVRKGQSLQSISKSFLGPGMECYIEALNDGIKSVSEGQKLKIPKLELRKKANK